ncbi:MAG: hypothetical protein IKL99_01375 [Oscillospiraceae bacterium]|nr:hypothetical protein [Oscillospiraceae bacterium]
MNEPNWEKMYMTLIDGVERALDALPKNVENELSRQYLIKGLLKAEEIYLSSTEVE